MNYGGFSLTLEELIVQFSSLHFCKRKEKKLKKGKTAFEKWASSCPSAVPMLLELLYAIKS
jgi:hypothetical protein